MGGEVLRWFFKPAVDAYRSMHGPKGPTQEELLEQQMAALWGGNNVQDLWRQIYGDQLGYSPEYQRQLFLQGSRDINQQYNLAQRRATTGLAQRGFYSQRPVTRMMSETDAARNLALTQYREGISKESEALKQRQQAQLFDAATRFKMLSQQQKFRLLEMAKQFEYDKDLMKLQDRLNSAGLGDFFGTIAGTGLGFALGGPVGGFIGGNLGGGGGN